jgi:hypothetical protein
MKKESEYTKQANDFAKKHNVKLSFPKDPVYKKHFCNDKEERWVFRCKLSRNGKSYTFDFGQSINSGAQYPELYDILSCLQKYDVGTFDNFCSEFGYDNDSISSLKIYKAVCKEWKAVERLFGDVLEKLQDIN